MMYKIRIEETLARNVYIDAEDELEAIEKVTDLYYSDKIELNAEDYCNTTFERIK